MVVPVWWQLLKLCGFLLHTVGHAQQILKNNFSLYNFVHRNSIFKEKLIGGGVGVGSVIHGRREVNVILLQLGWQFLPFPVPRKTWKDTGAPVPASPAGPSLPLWLGLYHCLCRCRCSVEKQKDFVTAETKWPTALIHFFTLLPRMWQICPFVSEMDLWSGHRGSAWAGVQREPLQAKVPLRFTKTFTRFATIPAHMVSEKHPSQGNNMNCWWMMNNMNEYCAQMNKILHHMEMNYHPCAEALLIPPAFSKLKS